MFSEPVQAELRKLYSMTKYAVMKCSRACSPSSSTFSSSTSLFGGMIVIVSLVRYFRLHLATRVFEIDSGKLNTYEGDYHYYLSKTGREE